MRVLYSEHQEVIKILLNRTLYTELTIQLDTHPRFADKRRGKTHETYFSSA